MSSIQIPQGWRYATLIDIVKDDKYAIKRGPWGSSIKKDFFVPDGYKVYQQYNVIYNDFDYGKYFLNENKFNELKEFEVKAGDFLISCSGTIGKVSIVPKNAKKGVMNQALLKISINDNEVLPEYFLYLIRSDLIQNQILSKGSAMKNVVAVNELKKIQLPLPSKPVQQKIVQKLDYILGQLEEKKKEILRRINEFDSEKIYKTYQNHLLNLAFSGTLTGEKLEESEMSKIKIPKGWNLDNLNKLIVDIEKHNPSTKPETEFKYVEIASIDNVRKRITSYKTLLGKNAPSRARNVIRTNDIIYATTRPYYRDVALVGKDLDEQICSTGFCVLRVKDKKILDPRYLFYYLLSDYANNQILPSMKGGNYPAVRNDDVIKIQIPLPMNIETQQKIVEILDKKFQDWDSYKSKIENIEKQYQHTKKAIETLPNSILNSAFSGKLVN